MKTMIVLACALSAADVSAAVILPSGLPSGSQYQLAFVTADTSTAISSNIADYNAFVTVEAVPLSAILPPGVTWTAIASTPNVNALLNAPNPSLPVYNTAGQLVAPASPGLYGVTDLTNPIDYDQFGNQYLDRVWTGTFADFSSDPIWSLGGSKTISQIGLASAGAGAGHLWIDNDRDSYLTFVHPLYALSRPITVPEPSSLLLLIGSLACLVWRMKTAALRSRAT